MSGRLRWAIILVLALLVAACGARPAPAPAATPAAAPSPTAERGGPRSGAVRASAKVVPAQKADLSFATAGRVRSVAVAAGDQVEAGAVLVTLEKAAAEAARAQAQAALAGARARLAELKAGPRPEEIASAQAREDAAQAQLAQLTEGARPGEVAAAKAELAATQAAQAQLYSGPRQEEQITAFTALSNAEAALRQAQAAYDRVSSRSDIGMLPESLNLQEATNNYKAVQARYEALRAAPSADVAAAAVARVQQAQAALDRLLAPATKSQISQAEAQARAAQAELDLLKAGAREEAVAVAAATATEAEAALQRAEADLAVTELRAPFGGTVASLKVNPGEAVLAGQAVLTVAELGHLQVETTDLSERDVARVAAGQPVTVFVEALGQELRGRVTQIALQATVVGGDSVYAVTVELDDQPLGLRWGMSAEVDIATTGR